jgi:hypothetical protein
VIRRGTVGIFHFWLEFSVELVCEGEFSDQSRSRFSVSVSMHRPFSQDTLYMG